MADGIRVLYVDDEEALLEMGKLFLEQNGEFSVDTVLSAPEALDILNKKMYDAIVSDYKMPEMDGIEFLKRVRVTDKNIPFIIFTGRSREEIVIEALNNGADFYLHKGGDPKALYQELVHFIRQSVTMRRTLLTLAEQEQRYHDLQNANDLIQSVTPDGHFLFVNKKWRETLGYEEREIPGLTIFDIIHEDSLKHCMETFQRVVSGDNVGIIDAVFKTRSGLKVYVEGMADCRMVDGKPQYTRGIFKDITDRKKADVALKESEERYRNVVEDQTEFISRFRPDGTFVFVNDAFCRYFNKTREEIIGKVYVPKIPEEDEADVARRFTSLTRENPVVTASNRVILEDGRIRWHQWSTRAVFDEEGRVQEYQSVGRDITELKEAEQELLRKNEELNAAFEELTATEEEIRANYDLLSRKEQALAESEEKYRDLSELLPQMVFEMDMAFRITYANRHALSVFGFNDVDLELGINALSFIEPSQHGTVKEKMEQQIRGIAIEPQEYTALRKNGSPFPVIIYSAPIYRNKTLTGFRGVIVDISTRKKMEDELREKESRFRTIFENSPYPITINSIPDGKFTAVNAAFLQSSGYQEAEVMGKSPVDLGMLTLLDYGRLTSHLLLSGKIENVPMVLTGKGGIRVHVQFSTIPVTINNRPAILTMTAEITRLKRVEEQLQQKNEELLAAYEKLTTTVGELRRNYDELSNKEQALRESEEKFRALVEHSLDGILITDFTGKLLFANRAAGLLINAPGYESMIGIRNVLEFVAPESKAEVLKDFAQVAQGIDTYLAHYKIITETKREIWVESLGKKIPFRQSEGVLISMRDVTEQRNAEEVLRESESKFTTIFKSSPVALTLVSATDGIFVDVNDAFVRNTGYTRKDVIGKTSEQFGIFADSNEQKQLIEKIVEQRAVHDIEVQCRKKTGEIRSCLFSSGIIHMEKKPYILSTIEDITGRRATESSFQALVRSMVGTTGLDSLRKITENVSSWLGADCVMVGEILPDRETVRVLAMLLDGKDVPDYSYTLKGTPCEDVNEKGFCLFPDNVTEIFPKSRDLVEFNIRGYVGTPLRNSAGEVIGILCALFRSPVKSPPAVKEIINIIAVKAAAEIERTRMISVLHESEERFRLLFQHVPSIAVQGYRSDGTVDYWNDASVRIYGYTAKEAIGKNLVDLIIPPEMRDEVRKAIAYMAESGQPIAASELSLMRKDGSRVAVFSSHAVVRSSAGSRELFCIDIDLTANKQAEDVIRATLADKEVLLREVHHRVKNNLQLISGLLDMTRMRTGDESTNSILTDIMLKIQTMGQIHTRLYESRQFGKINITDQFRDQVTALSEIYSHKGGAEISCEIDPVIVCLPVDQALPCALVVNEIISNAYKHAFRGRKHGKIEISAVQENDRIRITIRDNGVGLPDNFDISNTNSLGLKLIRTLVQHQLKGSFALTSQKGTKISIDFPVFTESTEILKNN